MSDQIRPDPQTPAPIPVVGSIDVHMAYLQRDVSEIKRTQANAFEKFAETLEQIRDGHPTRKEFEELARDVEKKADGAAFVDLKKYVEEKVVTKEDFAPIKKAHDRLTWLVISAVVLGLLGLLFASAA